MSIAQQHRKAIEWKEPTPKELLKHEIADECLFTNKYSKAERRNFYPFNKAASIILIAFNEMQRIPVKNKIIDEQQVLEKIILSREQIDSLSGIIYNVGFTPVSGGDRLGYPGMNCYEPRNGIVFVDKAGKAFEYIEICFACERREKSSERFNDGDYCSTKYDLLKNFFRTAGIKYGTDESNPALSYREIFKLDTEHVVSAIGNKLAKKTRDGADLSSLSKTELTLFFAINAEKIYYSSLPLAGLADFYFHNSGNYYERTITELKRIGANKTLNLLQRSKLQWPQEKIPTDLIKRRATLLYMINVVQPRWEKLESGLFDYQKEVGSVILTPKEDLIGLIFKYATLHQDELLD